MIANTGMKNNINSVRNLIIQLKQYWIRLKSVSASPSVCECVFVGAKLEKKLIECFQKKGSNLSVLKIPIPVAH